MPKAITIHEFNDFLNETGKSKDFILTGNIKTKNGSNYFELMDIREKYYGNKFYIQFFRFKNGNLPSYEANEKRSASRILYGKKVFLAYLDSHKEFELLSEYTKDKEKVKVRHKVCGNIFYPLPYNLKHGEGCPYCSREELTKKHRERMKEKVIPIDKIKDKVKLLTNNEYEIIDTSNYKNNKSKVTFSHNTPNGNHIFDMPVYAFLSLNHRCPQCKSSKGELKIREFLVNNNIEFLEQYSFDDCLGNSKPLSFDFYLKDKNILIEYNGIQHYKALDYFGGEDRLVIQKRYDSIKRKYCKNNNLKLIIIPYTKYKNIENILLEKII